MIQGSALGSRLLNVLSLENLRVPAKTLEALTDCSQQVAKLLGQIFETPVHKDAGQDVTKMLAKYTSIAAPLTRQGADLLEVLHHRVAVHAQHMTVDQLLVLQEGIARLQQSPNISASEEIQQLEVIKNAVNEALSAHANAMLSRTTEKMLPTLLQASSDLARETHYPGSAALRFASLQDLAKKLLQEQGFALYPNADIAAMQRELVQACCNQAIKDGNISSAALGDLLQALPPQQQAELQQTSQKIFQQAPSLFLQTLQQANQQWLQDTQQRFAQAQQTLNASPPLTGSALVEQFINFETALHQLSSHFAVRDEIFAPALSEITAHTLGQLQTTLLKPEDLPTAALDNRILRELGRSTARMGLDKISQRVTENMKQRQTAADMLYFNAMHGVAQALRSNDLIAAFDHLTEAANLRDQAAHVHQQLDAALTNAGQNLAFREQHMLAAVQQWNHSTLLAVHNALNQPAQSALTATLENLGNEILNGTIEPEDANAQLGSQLLDSHIDLLLLRQAVTGQLAQQDVPLPETQEKAYDPTDLDAQAFDAIRERFGIALHVQGKQLQFIVNEGMARQPLQAMFVDHLRSLTPTTVPATHAPIEQRVARAFWNELASTDYQIRAANGRLYPLVDHDALAQAENPEQKNQILTQAAMDLDRFLGYNPALLMQVSTLASSQLQAGVQNGLDSSDSPICLPDGRRGRLTEGKTSLAYVIGHDAQGAVTLQFQSNTIQTTQFWPLGLEHFSQSVDPQDSHFSAWGTLRIAQDLSLSTALPLQFRFNASPVISTVKDLVVSGNTALQEKFARVAHDLFANDSWNYLIAHHQYLQQPTAARVQNLIQRFIDENSDEQINISGRLINQIIDAPSLQQLNASLSQAAAQVGTMLDFQTQDFFAASPHTVL